METKTLKVILLGDTGTGKSCLFQSLANETSEFTLVHEATIGVDFAAIPREPKSKDVKYKLDLWDLGGDPRYAQVAQDYIPNTDVVLITLDAKRQDQWEAQIRKYKSIVERRAPDAEIIYVVNKWDYGLITLASNGQQLSHQESEVEGFYVNFKYSYEAKNLEEQKKNIDEATQKKRDECRRKIEEIHQVKKVLFYSTQSVTSEFRVIRENAITMKTALFEALDAAAAKKPADKKVGHQQKFQPIKMEDPSYFTWSGFFKAVLLFMGLSVVFLSLGGIAGGLEHIWPNIDGLFAAIQLGTDWGIGVTVASLGLALIITGTAVAWDYYSHRGGDTDLKIEDQDVAEYCQPPNSGQPKKTDPSQGRSPVGESKPRNDLDQEVKLEQTTSQPPQ